MFPLGQLGSAASSQDGCLAACAKWLGRAPDTCFVTVDGGEPGVSCSVCLPSRWFHEHGCVTDPVTGQKRCSMGRRPSSLVPCDSAPALHPVAAFFAEGARLEAASVRAFRVLARELAAHGAPRRLVACALEAAKDEVRHARATRQLARRYGAEPLRPTFSAQPGVRPLAQVARENAVEGCAAETYGAAVALWQARHAQDPSIAQALCAISRDEVRHAELAWEVAGWAEPRLSCGAQARVRSAREEAFRDLAREAAQEIDASLVTFAGLPSAAEGAGLLRSVMAAVPCGLSKHLR
ncbi:MAG TPA: ferritin-like domain-containing protein [Myxococcales bacterium]|nr:ferritin-like domain-containing protein [Myxococcales bacterium]